MESGQPIKDNARLMYLKWRETPQTAISRVTTFVSVPLRLGCGR